MLRFWIVVWPYCPWSCQYRHRHAWTSPNVRHSWDFQPVLILITLTFPSVCYFYNSEPSKLEGCWSAHPICARAVSQLVVERQSRRSVSCNVIAWADCFQGLAKHCVRWAIKFSSFSKETKVAFCGAVKPFRNAHQPARAVRWGQVLDHLWTYLLYILDDYCLVLFNGDAPLKRQFH